MKGATRVAKNTLVLVIDRYVLDIVNGVVAILVARYLGAYNLGEFSWVRTYVYFGTVLSNFGLRAVVVRDVARDLTLAERYFCNATLAMGGLGLVVGSGVVLFGLLGSFPPLIKTMLILAGASLPFASVRRVGGGMIRAFQRMEVAAVLGVVFTLIHVVATIIILRTGHGMLELMVLALLLAVLRSSTFLGVVHRFFVRLRFNFDRELFVVIFKHAFPIALIRAFGMLIQRVDMIMLRPLAGPEAVGHYNISLRVMGFAHQPSQAFTQALLPHLSERKGKSVRAMQTSYERAQRLAIMASFPVAILPFFFAEEIVRILFGMDYLQGGSAFGLQMLIWSLFVGMATGPVSGALINTEEKLMRFVPIAMGVAVFNILLNLWWIPVWGFIGACASTLICSVVQVAIKIGLIYGSFEGGPRVLEFARKPAVAGAAMAAVIYLVHPYHWILAAVFGSLTYPIVLIALGEIGPRERAIGRRLLRSLAGAAVRSVCRRPARRGNA